MKHYLIILILFFLCGSAVFAQGIVIHDKPENENVYTDTVTYTDTVIYYDTVRYIITETVTDAAASSLDFSDATPRQLKETAKAQNKPYFIYFSAEWCGPCKVIEESVFSNDEVQSYVAENYIAYKADVETFDGIELKQKYYVNELPTIIFFNAQSRRLETVKGVFHYLAFMQKLEEND